MPEENYKFAPSANLMQAEEINAIVRIFVKLGVSKIRLTGGEPLVRKDAGKIITALAKFPVTLNITTNGTRVHEFQTIFREANIKSVNVSLDTLDSQKFNLITRRNNFEKIWQNIHLLIEEGVHVKINVVAMKGLNDNEILDFVAWTKNTPIHIRFIEFMPFSGNRWTSNKVLTWQQILQIIKEKFSFIPLTGEPNGTAKKYTVPGHAGTFAVISTMTSPFCSTCNRMRLTADGKMKNCLFSKDETDLLSGLRNGEDIEQLIRLSIGNKAKELGGQLLGNYTDLNVEEIKNRSMISIGG